MSSQRQRSQAGYWTDVAQQLSEIASSVNYSTEAQLRHRMALVEFWEPAGVFYIVEFHPFAAVFETSEAGDMVPTYRYFHHELFFEGGEPSYAGKEIIETPTYEGQHSLSDIVCALIDAGAEDRVPARVSLHRLPGPPP